MQLTWCRKIPSLVSKPHYKARAARNNIEIDFMAKFLLETILIVRKMWTNKQRSFFMEAFARQIGSVATA